MPQFAYLYFFNKNNPDDKLFVFTDNGVMAYTSDLAAAEQFDRSHPIPQKEMEEMAAVWNQTEDGKEWAVGGWYEGYIKSAIASDDEVIVTITGHNDHVQKLFREIGSDLMKDPSVDPAIAFEIKTNDRAPNHSTATIKAKKI